MKNAKIALIFLGLKLSELFFVGLILLTLYLQIVLIDDIVSKVGFVFVGLLVFGASFIEVYTDDISYKETPIKYLYNVTKIYIFIETCFWVLTMFVYLAWIMIFGSPLMSPDGTKEAEPIVLLVLGVIFIAVLSVIVLSLFPIISQNWQLATKILDNHEKKNYVSTEETKEVE